MADRFFDGFTVDAGRDISRTIDEWYRSDAKRQNAVNRKQTPRPRDTIYHAVTTAAIPIKEIGEVEILAPDRITRSGVKVQAYTSTAIEADQTCLIVWTRFQSVAGQGAKTETGWHVIAPGNGSVQ